MNIEATIGRCTREELVALTEACINNLTDEDVVAVLERTLDDDVKAECAARWSE